MELLQLHKFLIVLFFFHIIFTLRLYLHDCLRIYKKSERYILQIFEYVQDNYDIFQNLFAFLGRSLPLPPPISGEGEVPKKKNDYMIPGSTLNSLNKGRRSPQTDYRKAVKLS
nr:hypothetical protein [Trentepohlia sp. YN1317]